MGWRKPNSFEIRTTNMQRLRGSLTCRPRAAQHPGIMNFPLKAGVLFLGTTFLFVASAQVPVNKNKEVRRPPIVRLSHKALNTDNTAAARKFYTVTLGYEPAFRINKPDGSLMRTNFQVQDHTRIQG